MAGVDKFGVIFTIAFVAVMIVIMGTALQVDNTPTAPSVAAPAQTYSPPPEPEQASPHYTDWTAGVTEQAAPQSSATENLKYTIRGGVVESISSDEPDLWTGSIPALVDSGMIQYYIQVADSSGRSETSPMAGWHTFFAHPTDACDEWLVGDLDNSGDLNVFDILLLSEVANNNGSGICPASDKSNN